MQVDVVAATLAFGERQVFNDVTAHFPSSCVSALIGPSGSGKSTLLAAMAGYQKLDRGEVIFNADTPESSRPDPSLVAWVPQGSNALSNRTALDNVLVAPYSEGRDEAEALLRAYEALSQVRMRDRAADTARTLSGGELQRVSFARALASSKPLIFADEPSASLDAANTELLGELLRGLRTRASVIVATHDPILIDAAEHVVSLRSETHHADR